MKKQTPNKAMMIHPSSTVDGWWYENHGSIDIYASHERGYITNVRIRKADILKWLERTKNRK